MERTKRLSKGETKEPTGQRQPALLGRLRRGVLIPILFIALAFAGSVSLPLPAQAWWLIFPGEHVARTESISLWGIIQTVFEKTFGKIKDILLQLGQFFGQNKDEFDEVEDDIIGTGQAVVTAIQGKTEATVRSLEMLDQDKTLDRKNQSYARIAADNELPPSTEQLLCNLVIVRQLGVSMEPFMDMIHDFVRNSIMLAWMGPTSPGRGPGYVHQMWEGMCGDWNNGQEPPTGRRLLGMPESCIPSGVAADSGGSLFKFEGGDTSPLPWGTALKVPYMNATTASIGGANMTVGTPTLDPDDYAVKRFMAARRLCYNMAGARPPVPYGEILNLREGETAALQFMRCAKEQEDIVDACAIKVAYMTRPDCDNDGDKGFCYFSTAACGAAQALGFFPAASYDNCRYGLSFYESLKLMTDVCLTDERSISGVVVGGTYGGEMDAVSMCKKARTTFARIKAFVDTRMKQASGKALELGGCWVDYGSLHVIAEAALERQHLAEKTLKNKKEARRADKAAALPISPSAADPSRNMK